MSTPKEIDTGLADPKGIATELLRLSLPLIAMRDQQAAGREVMVQARQTLAAWARLFHRFSAHYDHNDSHLGRIAQLKALRVSASQIEISQGLSETDRLLATELAIAVDKLIRMYDKKWRHRYFPILPDSQKADGQPLMISRMHDYRLFAECRDCETLLFSNIPVPELVQLIGKDVPWGSFRIVCPNDHSHDVSVVAPYAREPIKDVVRAFHGDLIAVNDDE